MVNLNLVIQEAHIYSHYLVKQPANALAINLYKKAISKSRYMTSDDDSKLLNYIHKHPKFIGLIDAGLAISNPHSEVRRRIYSMFAILEALPNYSNQFLPVKRPFYYFFYIAWLGVATILKTIFGYTFIKSGLWK